MEGLLESISMSLIGTLLGNPKGASARDWQQCHRFRESKPLPRCQSSIWETLEVEVVEGKKLNTLSEVIRIHHVK
jgi:hypothetical protein